MFTITDRAASWFKNQLGEIPDGEVCVVTLFRGFDENLLDPQWSIGLYKKSQISKEPIEVINGIEFVIQPYDRAALAGRAVDIIENRIVIS